MKTYKQISLTQMIAAIGYSARLCSGQLIVVIRGDSNTCCQTMDKLCNTSSHSMAEGSIICLARSALIRISRVYHLRD